MRLVVHATTRSDSCAAEVVLGLGGTVDLEVGWDADTLSMLAAEYCLTPADLVAPRALKTERDVLCAVLSHVPEGTGGEYFVDEPDALGSFTDRFASVRTLGGTPVRAAIAMDRIGMPSTVHLVSVDDTVRRLMPPTVEIISSADHDSFDPHVIVQFPAGATVRVGSHDFVTPHPNRVILSNDLPNQLMVISEELGDAVEKARVIMVSGFNSMRNVELLERRLSDVTRHLARRNPSAIAWYEHSGFHVSGFSDRVRMALGQTVDIWSCNEDELAVHLGHRIDLLDPKAVVEAVRRLHADVGSPTVVVHSRHWALAVGGDSAVQLAALDGGIASASARYAFGDHVDRSRLDTLAQWPRQPDAVRFVEELASIAGPPISARPAFLIPVDSPTTIGLGDTFVGGALAALRELRSGEA
ncbi:ADP-dependent glucokinase/phosphofructokinase [Marisediminicola sp. LYQ85]|uniref:ADP-dependent glucokinase/phosphofructokinase n=1 Tax=Marisediminicola sp. LYQ85 TaxID=3391062 RepID=UPI0039837C63